MPAKQDRPISPGIEPRALRAALGQFATGVAIMTARDTVGEPIGITVNSFTSVSLEPPLILWCVTLTSPVSDLFGEGAPFVVNILSDDQLAQAKQFARSDRSDFKGAHFRLTASGLPQLEGCVATLECSVIARYPGGDHAIVLSEVTGLSRGGDHPLVFFGGQFRRLTATHLGGEGRPAWFPWLDV